MPEPRPPARSRLDPRQPRRASAGPSPGRARRAPAIALLLGSVLATLAACAPAAPPGPTWSLRFPDADTARSRELAPGVLHRYLWLPRGPWAVHVVEIDPGACGPVLRARKAGPPLADRAPTSALGAGAVAAVNADFFLSPLGTPVGPHVHGGRVLVGPGARPALGLDSAGRLWAGAATLEGLVAVPGDTVRLTRLNRPADGGRHHPVRPGIALFDRWHGPYAPAAPGPALRVARLPAPPPDGAVGGPAAWTGRGVIEAVTLPPDSVALSTGQVALHALDDAAEAWIRRRDPGDTVVWRSAVVPADAPVPVLVEAVGGFPLLVRGGEGVVADQPGVIASFGARRHPRTAVGWDAAGRVLLVVVDGRQAPYSDGMTLRELEWMMLRLGATEALNLDGGGSSTLVAGGEVVNRPSDADGERAVSNALVLEGCAAR